MQFRHVLATFLACCYGVHVLSKVRSDRRWHKAPLNMCKDSLEKLVSEIVGGVQRRAVEGTALSA